MLSAWFSKHWLAIILTAGVAYSIHYLAVWHLENEWQDKLDKAVRAEKTECQNDKKITREVSHDYQEKISELRDQLAAAKRVHAGKCVVPVAKPTPGYNAATGLGESVQAHGISAEWLLDYADEAEGYRVQVNALQSFITKTWEAKGQE